MEIRPAGEEDRCALAEMFAAVAEEGDGIATEPPVDVDERARAGRSSRRSSRSSRDRSSGTSTSA